MQYQHDHVLAAKATGVSTPCLHCAAPQTQDFHVQLTAVTLARHQLDYVCKWPVVIADHVRAPIIIDM